MRYIGQGLFSFETLCSLMCLPNPVSQKAYGRINAKIADVISGYGTWKTSRHTFLIGVGTLIGADCGKVLDIEVMSPYCKECNSYKGPKMGLNTKLSAEKTIAGLLEERTFAECRFFFDQRAKTWFEISAV
ncbi:uncharacterized protein TNCV_1957841 [Trichonephila clavipes]|nr:uncharacterized protein TNCV_1957841 [Trichonephila clavipes]